MDAASYPGLLAKIKELRLQLEELRLNGYDWLDGPLPKDWVERLVRAAEKTADVATVIETKKGVATVPPQKEEDGMGGSKESQLKKIATEIAACTACSLCDSRINTVPGIGNPDARILFIGEAPGASEDKVGEPFVGRAGKLLTDMIAAMGFARDQIYIANILKCRPPNNRDPLPAEVELCEPFLKRQIAIIQPEVICALGAISAQTLLRTEKKISELRGVFTTYESIPLLPTYHPAYLLRSPKAKGTAWSDLQMILAKLGLSVPSKK